jgi:ankyrin repeat protein
MVKQLLRLGARLNITELDAFTPSEFVGSNQNVEIVRLLLAAGAIVDVHRLASLWAGVHENPIRKFFEDASNFAEKGFRLG